MTCLRASIVALFACLTAVAAGAAPITIFGNVAGSTDHTGATFTGSLDYNSSTDVLTIKLTNTSPSSVGGFLTGFVFDLPGTDHAVLTSATDANFTDLSTSTHANALSIAPFGTYDAGAALGGMILGGGSPNGGLAVGASGTFTFHVTGADAGTLTDSSFLTDGLIARFKGLANGGSDKVPTLSGGGGGGGVTPGASVPLPAAVIPSLAVLAMLALAAKIRRVIG